MEDVPQIHRLINYHAELDRMLFRTHGDLYEHLRDFFVYAETVDGEERILGCAALELVWRDLAEIKSLAIEETSRGKGIGSQLIQAILQEARRLGLKKVFALTREERFFSKMGFTTVKKETLPHKVWTDCVRCPLRDQCDETPMIMETDALEKATR
jgi:amino-acid N-acetyltransferase